MSYVKIINEDEKTKFESGFRENGLWIKEFGSKLKSLLPDSIYSEIFSFDYFMFYNKTNNIYNLYPKDGFYELMFIAYDYELSCMEILWNYGIMIN